MIGIFDSGIGGVTVLHELLKVLPHQDYLYYSDSINNPYGDKSSEELIKIVDDVVLYLIDKGCEVIVIACNTASSVCKDYLRKKYDIPFIAIEPAYKMVYDYAREKKTLVMATKATIESKHFLELYNKYDNHNTILCSCSGLADLIEDCNSEAIEEYLVSKIGKYKGVENVVLGCTHYPLIKKEINSILGNVNFFDGSKGVSAETKRICIDKKILKSEGEGHVEFFDSSNDKTKEKLFFYLAYKEEI